MEYFGRKLRFFELDLERLGRWHRNKLSGGRRKKSRISQRGSYNYDRAIGSALYRALVHSSILRRPEW